MKVLRFLPIIVFAMALAFTTSCGKSGASKGADIVCEMKGIQNDLMKAYEENDEAKIEELTKKIEEKQKEMEEFGKEMEEKYKDDKDGEAKAKKEMFESLTECEHFTKEEMEAMKQAQGIE
jgi:vacuolar-type H+-ATPase subunit I/STV1